MLTRELWFKARRVEKGTGYSLVHWKGAAAICAITLLSCIIGILPALLFGSDPLPIAAGLIAAGTVFCVLLLSLVRFTAQEWTG